MICNLERLHPCKKDKILAGLLLLEERNRQRKLIDKVIVFGSSVTESCTDESDIDVCIVSPFTCEDEGYFRLYCDFFTVMNDDIDLINFNHMGPGLKKEVMKKGVVVYEYTGD